MGSNAPLKPTWEGFVATTYDGLTLFEACLSGYLHHVQRRPHDKESSQLIRSGCVFVYEENASGIKRWTDGVAWSPSRILGNFLLYRELSQPFPPGEKKRAQKRNKRVSRPGEPYPASQADDARSSSGEKPDANGALSTLVRPRLDRERERQLYGSLLDSYAFKEDGLIKKTMSIINDGIQHHLVSYYKADDVASGRLKALSEDPFIRSMGIRPRYALIYKQQFRVPLEGAEEPSPAEHGPDRSTSSYRVLDGKSRSISSSTSSYSQHAPLQTLPHAQQSSRVSIGVHSANPALIPSQHFGAQDGLGILTPVSSTTQNQYYQQSPVSPQSSQSDFSPYRVTNPPFSGHQYPCYDRPNRPTFPSYGQDSPSFQDHFWQQPVHYPTQLLTPKQEHRSSASQVASPHHGRVQYYDIHGSSLSSSYPAAGPQWSSQLPQGSPYSYHDQRGSCSAIHSTGHGTHLPYQSLQTWHAGSPQ